MRYRNIIEYADSLKLKSRSFSEARLSLHSHIERLFEERGDIARRGKKQRTEGALAMYALRSDPRFMEIEKISDARLRAKRLKHLFRRSIVETIFEAHATQELAKLELLTLPEYDKLADAQTAVFKHTLFSETASNYPFRTYARSRNRISGNVAIVPNDKVVDGVPIVEASYSRGHFYFSVSMRACAAHDLPCDRVLNKPDPAVILDCARVTEDAWFMQWAQQKRGTQELHVMRGAFCKNVLVPGYLTEQDVLTNIEDVRYQAQVKAVTHVLSNAA